MDDEEWNLSRYWNLKDFGPYMEAKAGKSNKPASKKRLFRRSTAEINLPHEIHSELISHGSHPSEWQTITRRDEMYGLRSGEDVLLYHMTGKNWEPVKQLTSGICTKRDYIALSRRNIPARRSLGATGLTRDFSLAKTAKGPVSWEQLRNDLYTFQHTSNTTVNPGMFKL